MDKKIAERESRKIGGKSYRSITLCGVDWETSPLDLAAPNYNTGTPVNYFWHTFDQILLRPELLRNFDPSGLHVVTRVGDRELIRSHRIDDKLSDHLPIVIRLEIEQGT